MTTSTPLPTSPAAPVERLPLRLALEPAVGDGAVDGSWWPQSRDLAVELADLVDHFPPELGQVTRAVFSRPDWDSIPRRVQVARGSMKVGSYPRADMHQVWLTMSTYTLIRLSVTAAQAGTGEDEALTQWNDEGSAWWDPHPVAPSHRV